MSIKDTLNNIFKIPKDDYDDMEDYNFEEESDERSFDNFEENVSQPKDVHRVVSFNAGDDSDKQVIIMHLDKYENVEAVASAFKNNMVVVVNIEKCSEDVCERILYFLAGVVYGLGGEFKGVGGRVYILTPKAVSIVLPTDGKNGQNMSTEFKPFK